MTDYSHFHIAALFVWLAVSCVGPGLFFVRHLRWKPLETLCASVGASLAFIYLGSLAIYAFDWPVEKSHGLLSAVCWGLTALCWRDIRRLIHRRHIRRVLGAFGILWAWILLQAADIRSFSGGSWYGDWIEHYKRCLFFLEHWDLKYRFLGMYLVTARPPLMNLVCAHFMALFGKDFVIFQLTAGFLNLLPALVCFLWATAGVRRGWGRKGATAALVVLLAANPLFMENVAFAWTKSLTAMPCLLAAWFYLRGWVKQDGTRITIAFVFAAMACLVHYYALAWTAGLALHYFLAVWPRRKEKFRELIGIGAICTALIASWLLWAVWAYGAKTPFTSNTTAWAVKAQTPLERIQTVGFNCITTIVPHFLRDAPYDLLSQTDRLGYCRDLIFCVYQTNALFAWGIFGGIVLLVSLRQNRWPASVRRFWCVALVCSAVLGIASIPTPEAWGTMDLWGLPHLLLGLSALAAFLGEMSRPWRWIAACGCAIDFAAGILLQLHLEHRIYAVQAVAGQTLPIVVAENLPSKFAQENFVARQVLGYKFIGDYFSDSNSIEILLCLLLAAMLVVFMQQSVLSRARQARSEQLVA